jgi:ABC-type nitrate/sulfonate/bicarbonate transport system ATPase subunit
MISLDNVTVSVGGAQARTLTFDLNVKEGDCILLVGPNGAGKTTLLDLIVGVRRSSSGTISLGEFNKPIAYAVQSSDGGLLPWFSIERNIMLPHWTNEMEGHILLEKAQKLLSEVGLGERARDYPYTLSGGEKQLVNLIRTLCTPAQLVLLDEPFSFLSHEARRTMALHLSSWIKHRTAIVVSHDRLSSLLPFNRYLVMNPQGRLREVDLNEIESIMPNDTER